MHFISLQASRYKGKVGNWHRCWWATANNVPNFVFPLKSFGSEINFNHFPSVFTTFPITVPVTVCKVDNLQSRVGKILLHFAGTQNNSRHHHSPLKPLYCLLQSFLTCWHKKTRPCMTPEDRGGRGGGDRARARGPCPQGKVCPLEKPTCVGFFNKCPKSSSGPSL